MVVAAILDREKISSQLLQRRSSTHRRLYLEASCRVRQGKTREGARCYFDVNIRSYSGECEENEGKVHGEGSSPSARYIIRGLADASQ